MISDGFLVDMRCGWYKKPKRRGAGAHRELSEKPCQVVLVVTAAPTYVRQLNIGI